MWRNYLTVGLRALAKSRIYAFITIGGLAIGIAACLLILTFVRYELSYDAWLPDAGRTFQFQTSYLPTSKGGDRLDVQSAPLVAEAALRKDFPQIERAAWLSSQRLVIEQNGVPSSARNAAVTDGPLFAVLRVPFVRGNAQTALDDPHAVVLSEREAKLRFGDADPLGRTLSIAGANGAADYRVTGVFRDMPKNSNILLDTVIRVDPADYFRTSPGAYTQWGWTLGNIYVRLRPGTDAHALQAQLPAWEKRNIPDDLGTTPATNPGDSTDWRFVNIRDVHLGGASGQGRPTGDKGAILSFAVVALLILAMACMNFTNLATARASQRAREVALRKVLGASRGQLVLQFLIESVLVASIAMLVALALAELAIRPLDAFLDADMSFHYWGSGGVLLPVIALTLLVGVAGGAYPAFALSRFEPARILKANKSAADAQGSGRLRGLLVIAQFAVSIGLIICTAVIYAQTAYARHADAGYRREGLIQIDGIDRAQVDAAMPALLDRLRGAPGIVDAARVGQGVATGNNSTTDINRPGRPPVTLGIYAADGHAFATLGVPLLAGRLLSDANPMDDSTTPTPPDPTIERAFVARGTNVVLSRLATERLGFRSPAEAIGQPVQLLMASPELGPITATIVGVVADVRYRSARDPVQPILYYDQRNNFSQLLVRFRGSPKPAGATLETLWKQQLPDVPLRVRYVEDIVHDLYTADQKRATLFGGFATLAVVIGCLGLFGLAAFTAERRTKEIGVRKVLGARTRDIVRLLVWQFSRPVLVANLIAWPVAWWVMRGWLNGFDVRIALTPLPFLLAGVLALAIAVLTVAGHAYRVARTSPVHALRYE